LVRRRSPPLARAPGADRARSTTRSAAPPAQHVTPAPLSSPSRPVSTETRPIPAATPYRHYSDRSPPPQRCVAAPPPLRGHLQVSPI
jgi:hypothetical protein